MNFNRPSVCKIEGHVRGVVNGCRKDPPITSLTPETPAFSCERLTAGLCLCSYKVLSQVGQRKLDQNIVYE